MIELPLRHLKAAVDGPTSSNAGFIGPVCSQVDTVEYDPNFKAVPGSEDMIPISEEVLSDISDEQKNCCQLVLAVKFAQLPQRLHGMKCGPLFHARWLTRWTTDPVPVDQKAWPH